MPTTLWSVLCYGYALLIVVKFPVWTRTERSVRHSVRTPYCVLGCTCRVYISITLIVGVFQMWLKHVSNLRLLSTQSVVDTCCRSTYSCWYRLRYLLSKGRSIYINTHVSVYLFHKRKLLKAYLYSPRTWAFLLSAVTDGVGVSSSFLC